VIIKMLRQETRSSDKMVLLEEAAARKSLSHRNIVTLLGVCTKSAPNFIIEEYFPIDLKHYLREAAPTRTAPATITIAEQISIAQELVDGLCYLDTMRYVHKGIFEDR
jgi:serine/threonine protein kinase